jgi:uncharacterized Ntn-hydrolase superfamily protein
LTYSIIARDPETGDLGVGVQSRAFASGSGVAWVEPGAGAVATQAFTERSYGPLALRRLRDGEAPDDALAALTTGDELAFTRQVAVVDIHGRVATHTGEACIADAGHAAGDGFSAQANMCRGPVWEAMAEAFAGAAGSLARRLLTALEAAERSGGDFRGRQSAALLVRPADGKPWERVSDLRVDDHPEPLAELDRLLTLEEAYRAVNRAPAGEGETAAAPLPELDRTWARIVDHAATGDVAGARSLLDPLLAAEPRWAAYVRALAAMGEIPDATALLDGA